MSRKEKENFVEEVRGEELTSDFLKVFAARETTSFAGDLKSSPDIKSLRNVLTLKYRAVLLPVVCFQCSAMVALELPWMLWSGHP